MESIAIGVGAGAFCYLAVRLRARTKLDDSLDVVGVHGIGGTWGALATGIFAASAIGGFNGLTHGEASQVGDQLVAIGAVWAYSFIVTMIILKVLDLTMGLRVSEEEEVVGLDVSQHGERAYVIEETAGGVAGVAAMMSAPPTASRTSGSPGGGA